MKYAWAASAAKAATRLVMATWCAAIVTGCSTTHIPSIHDAPPLTSESAKTPNSGVVIVSVTGNTARTGGQFEFLTLRAVGPEGAKPQDYALKQVTKGLARDTALFIGVVPAGTYTVSQLSGGMKYINFSQKTQESVGRIKVAPYGVHDLGRIVVTALNTNVLIGRSKTTTANLDLVRRFAPDTAALLNGTPDQGWAGPRNEKDIVEEYAMSTPVGADSLQELPGGEVVAASRLGTVLLRSRTGGDWRLLPTGRLESLLSISPSEDPDAKLYACGEFNTLVKVDTAWKPSMLNAGDLPAGNLIFMAGNKQDGWYMVHQRLNNITIYKSVKLDAGEWRAVRSESTEASFWSGSNSFWAWRTQNGFAYAMSHGHIMWLDVKTGTWTTTRSPNNTRILSVASNADGSVGLLTSPGGGFGGVFASNYLSKDQGQSWTEIKTPFNVLATPPRVTGNGVILSHGGVFSKTEVQASHDGGKTWKPVTDTVKLSQLLVPLPTKGLFAIDDGGQSFGLADIRHSADDGKTWKLEYSNFNHHAYEASNKP